MFKINCPVFTIPLVFICLPLLSIGQEIEWEGLSSLTVGDDGFFNESTNISDPANWSTGAVPGNGDTAAFIFRGNDGLVDDSGRNNVQGNVTVNAADTLFNPSRLEFNSNSGSSNFRNDSDLIIDKDLNLDGLLISGFGNSGGSGQQQNRLRFGINETGVTINLNGSIEYGTQPGWGFFSMGGGDATAGSGTVWNFTGATTDFLATASTLNQRINVSNYDSIENLTNDKAPQMRFTAVGGTINLGSTGQRTTGTIGLGLVHLDVRSDQTWNVDPLGFVAMNGSRGNGNNPGRFLVESIDGGRLDNLGGLNIRVDGTTQSMNASNAMQLYGGTYGSLWIRADGNTVGRTQRVQFTDDASFVARAVDFDSDGDPYQTDYSMIIESRGSGTRAPDSQIIDVKTFDVDLDGGLLLVDNQPRDGSAATVKLLLDGGTLTVGGDIVMDADPVRRPSGISPSGVIAIDGGASGSSVFLDGNWDVRTLAANNTAENMSTSLLAMTGGTEGAPVTFEVGDAVGTTGVQFNTWSIETLQVGVDSGDTARVRLVNDYLNNNPFVSDEATDKAGEKLVVGTLDIKAGSYFDANLAEAFVEVGESTLLLEPGATLDLNTGLTLTEGLIISDFVGLGDQTIAWTAFADQVIDSSNPLWVFAPVLDSGDTHWQAVGLIPEPSTVALIIGSLALARRGNQPSPPNCQRFA